MMLRYLAPVLLLLSACAGPAIQQPPARKQANANLQAAAQASHSGKWQAAAALWRDAANQQAALDDWPAAGRAMLGWAQALSQLGKPEEAQAILQRLLSAKLSPTEIEAEARYQMALLEADKPAWSAALNLLEQAGAQLPANHPLQAAMLNLRAREAWGRGDWALTRDYAGRALAVTSIEAPERANALRLQGRAATRQQDWAVAAQALNAALAQDHELARSPGLVADLRALAELARLRGDPEATALEQRATMVCSAAGLANC